MISVIIPTLNAERTLAGTLAALIPAAVEGLVREVIVADGGSTDQTRRIADGAGTDVVDCQPGRGRQLNEGAKRARFPWLLFLHADTALGEGWMGEVEHFIAEANSGETPPAAAAFRFHLDDRGLRPRLLELAVAARCGVLRLPYGDQGLLIPRRLFDAVGGYRDMPIMEDVDLVRRLGRSRLMMLEARATTSAERYRKDGYAARIARNQLCLAFYFAGVSPQRIARLYSKPGRPEVAIPARSPA